MLPGGPCRRRGNGLVVGLTGFAEDVGGDDLALVLPDVGQQPDAGDVANGPQAVAGAQVGVDGDAVPVSVDVDGLEADPVHPGRRPVARRRWSPRTSPPSSSART